MIAPKPRPQPIPVRPRWRRHVTIVAGFRSYQGIVLCADTQETVGNLSKRNVPKLIFQPADEYGQTKALLPDDLAVAFCGAADNGPFVDKLVENAWEEAQIGTSLDEVCTLIEVSIKKTYREYGQIFQTGYCPSADLIYGVKMFGSSKLFWASGPVVLERKTHYSGGAGYYMADFLAARMYYDGMNLRQCVILAAYILFQAREHVDGCGGDSHIAILRDDGVSGKVDYLSIESINKMFRWEDAELGRLILHAADLEVSNQDFQEHAKQIAELAASMRQIEKADYDATRINHRHGFGWMLSGGKQPDPDVDEYGLPMPLDSQTSEDQQ
jgi:20S proteasome alpha/beta subunit